MPVRVLSADSASGRVENRPGCRHGAQLGARAATRRIQPSSRSSPAARPPSSPAASTLLRPDLAARPASTLRPAARRSRRATVAAAASCRAGSGRARDNRDRSNFGREISAQRDIEVSLSAGAQRGWRRCRLGGPGRAVGQLGTGSAAFLCCRRGRVHGPLCSSAMFGWPPAARLPCAISAGPPAGDAGSACAAPCRLRVGPG